jgi:hypothetical protein
MSKIQISNLTPGTELFQGTESFLTELKSTEAHQIHGGKGKSKKSGSKKSKRGSGKSNKSNKSGSNSSGNNYYFPLPPVMCRPCGC